MEVPAINTYQALVCVRVLDGAQQQQERPGILQPHLHHVVDGDDAQPGGQVAHVQPAQLFAVRHHEHKKKTNATPIETIIRCIRRGLAAATMR